MTVILLDYEFSLMTYYLAVQQHFVTGIVSIGDLVNWIISTQNAEIEQLEQYIAGGVAA